MIELTTQQYDWLALGGTVKTSIGKLKVKEFIADDSADALKAVLENGSVEMCRILPDSFTDEQLRLNKELYRKLCGLLEDDSKHEVLLERYFCNTLRRGYRLIRRSKSNHRKSHRVIVRLPIAAGLEYGITYENLQNKAWKSLIADDEQYEELLKILEKYNGLGSQLRKSKFIEADEMVRMIHTAELDEDLIPDEPTVIYSAKGKDLEFKVIAEEDTSYSAELETPDAHYVCNLFNSDVVSSVIRQLRARVKG